MHNAHLKFAIRNVWKYKFFGLINVIGLAIGMTSFVLILLWVQNEYTFDQSTPDHASIFRVTYTSGDQTQKWDGSPFLLASEAVGEIPEMRRVARLKVAGMNNPVLQVNNMNFREKSLVYVDSAWFSLFRAEVKEGTMPSLSNANRLVITENIAKKYFGSKKAIGQVISVDSFNYQVGAVIKNNPANTSFPFEVFLPMKAYISRQADRAGIESWDRYDFMTFVDVQPDGVDRVTAKLNTLFRSKIKETKAIMSLLPLKDLHFETGITGSDIPHGDKKITRIFLLVGILLLVVACMNFVNLSTAMAGLRTREISIKKIMGAERRSLITQIIWESALVCITSLVITMALVAVLLPVLNRFTGGHFTFLSFAFKIGQILLLALLLSIVFTSIYPALLISAFDPIKGVKGLTFFNMKKGILRKGMVTVQFIFSIVLIAGNLLIYKQLNFIERQNAGFSGTNIFSFSLPVGWLKGRSAIEKTRVMDMIRQQLSGETSITKVASGSSSVLNDKISMAGVAGWSGKRPDFNPMVSPLAGDKDFLAIFPLTLVEGRWFLNGEADQHNYILNEAAVAEFGLRGPLAGQPFSFFGDTGKIIGVVKDFHYRSYHEKIGSLVILNKPGWRNTIFIKPAKDRTAAAVDAVSRVYRGLFAGQPFQFSFIDDEFNELYSPDIRAALLVRMFSYIAILLSCLGLFGLAALTAQQRTKEIGIRKILGANEGRLTALLSGEFFRLVLLAFFIATPLAWWLMNRWLQDFAYQTSLDWWIFGLAGVIALLVAMFTVGIHAIRLARANPVKILRME